MVNVVGLGYIGLPTALMLASLGIKVVGTDYNEELVHTLNEGKTTFKEKGLDALFRSALESGISFVTTYQKSEIYIISVPTPYDKATKKIDPQYVVEAVKDVLQYCGKGAILVIESTISPGTIDRFIRPVVEAEGLIVGSDVHLVHAPERIIPGNMVYELKHNSRTVGADDEAVAKQVKELYGSFCEGEIVTTDIRTAEMTKVVENTFRDINIAYANELAKICRSDGMDVHEIIRIANKHPRVNILSPGPGVGGHCISVDPWFLVGDYPELARIIKTARTINDSMPEYVLARIHDMMKANEVHNVARIGIYGLTYKEDVDDVRESPTLQLLDNMERHLSGNQVKVYDPFVQQNIVPNQYHDLQEFVNDVDLIVIMVAHSELKNKTGILREKIVLDARHVFNKSQIDNLYYL